MIRSRYTAAITDKLWWLASGIAPSACVAAYQPVGASSYVASKTNLAYPGLYDATDADAPSWDPILGWTGDGTPAVGLKTGIVPNGGDYSVIVRYSGVTTASVNRIFGAYGETTTARFYIIPNYSSKVYYSNGPNVTPAPALQAGVLAMAGRTAYRNGVVDGTMAAWSGTLEYDIYLLAENSNGSIGRSIAGSMQAIAIYKSVITGQDVAELTRVMNAL